MTFIDDNLEAVGGDVICRHCSMQLGTRAEPLKFGHVTEVDPAQAGPGVRAGAGNYASRPIVLRRVFCPKCLTQLKAEIVPADEATFRSSVLSEAL